MREVLGKRIAVIGGAGFLGSHLTRYLMDNNCEVIVIDNLLSGKREYVPSGARLFMLDISRELSRLVDILMREEVDYVFNYAALPFIPDCLDEPLRAVEVNTIGAMNVLEASRIAEVEGVMMVTSAEVYGNDGSGNICPVSTYACSKAAIDLITQARVKESGVPAIVLRQFNCIGERETHPYVVPEIISQVQRELDSGTQDVLLHLGRNTYRDFMYAGDAVIAAVRLMEKANFGEWYDLGSGTPTMIYPLARKIAKLMGARSCDVKHDLTRERPAEVFHLQSQPHFEEIVGHDPNTTPFDEALRRTIADYRENGWSWE